MNEPRVEIRDVRPSKTSHDLLLVYGYPFSRRNFVTRLKCESLSQQIKELETWRYFFGERIEPAPKLGEATREETEPRRTGKGNQPRRA